MSRKIILEEVNPFFDMEGSVENVIKRLQEEKDYFLSEGYSDIILEYDYSHGYETETRRLILKGYREESDAEHERRLNKEKEIKRKQEEREKAELERLKKKYGETE